MKLIGKRDRAGLLEVDESVAKKESTRHDIQFEVSRARLCIGMVRYAVANINISQKDIYRFSNLACVRVLRELFFRPIPMRLGNPSQW